MTGHTLTATGATRADLGLRPVDLHLVDQRVAGRVIPPPADAVAEEERWAMVADEPLSLLRVLGPEGDDGATAGRRAGERIRALVAAGRYHHHGPVLAVHELVADHHRQRGLIAGIPLEDVRAGRVRAHEQTRAHREEKLSAFLDAAGMDVSPVLLTHTLIPELDHLLDTVVTGPPDLAFEGWHGVRQRVWVVDDPDLQARIRTAAAPIGLLTIVDGHHRVAAALRTADAASAPDTLLAELIPDRDLRIIGYDRRVELDHPDEADAIMAGLVELAEVRPLPAGVPPRPATRDQLLVGTARGWVSATLRDVPDRLPDRLPVALLQHRVLAPLVGIADPRTDPRLKHVPGLGDLRALDASLHRGPAVAFVPPAVTVDELRSIAEAGEILPPKATYMDPKPGPGVVLRLRDRPVGTDP